MRLLKMAAVVSLFLAAVLPARAETGDALLNKLVHGFLDGPLNLPGAQDSARFGSRPLD